MDPLKTDNWYLNDNVSLSKTVTMLYLLLEQVDTKLKVSKKKKKQPDCPQKLTHMSSVILFIVQH